MNRKRIAHTLAAVTTGLLFAATLFCRSASYISPGKGEFWALTAMLLPVALLLDVVLLVGWLARGRWRLAALPLTAILLCHSYLSALVQLPEWGRTQTQPRLHDLRIMTLNAYGFLRLGDHFTTIPAIARVAEREKVDVLCLQEAFPSPVFPGDSITAWFTGNFPYFVRSDMIALGSRYPIANHHSVSFPGTLNDYLWADLVIGTDTVRLFTMHLRTTGFTELKHRFQEGTDHPGLLREVVSALGRNSRFRAQQVEEIRQVIDTTRYPVILTGDFNDPPGTYTYHRLKGSMTDSFRAAGHGCGSTYRRLGGWLRIDYIFHDKNFTTTRYDILPDDVSDHSAVIADLRFEQ